MFLFWGSGSKSKSWELEDGNTLICVYRYFHIWFVIRFVTSKRWFIQADKRSEDSEATQEEVVKMFKGNVPKINAYSA
jgi:hypothetical protein